MLYRSTRNGKNSYSAAEVILQGLAPDGGLFTPVEIPRFEQWESLLELSYSRRAAALMQPYLDGFSEKEINAFCTAAYDSGRFDHPSVAPLRRLTKNLFFLELWHGPTCAFKDMALQILPHLMRGAAAKNRDTAQRLILTATSGDTGKAALEGFRDIPGTRIVVFFPVDGVSEIQKRQMVTQEGSNVHVIAIRGNFDAAERGQRTLCRRGAGRCTGGPGLQVFIGQFHQLGPPGAANRLLFFRLPGPGPGAGSPCRGARRFRGAHRQLRQHPGRVYARQMACRCANLSAPSMRTMFSPTLSTAAATIATGPFIAPSPLYGHSYFQQPGAPAL